MQYEWILQQISMPRLSRQLTIYIFVHKNDYKNWRNLHISHWCPSFQPHHALGAFQPGQGEPEQPHSVCSALNVWDHIWVSPKPILWATQAVLQEAQQASKIVQLKIPPFTQGSEETTSMGWDRPPSAQPPLGATAPGAGNEDPC